MRLFRRHASFQILQFLYLQVRANLLVEIVRRFAAQE